MNSGTFHVYEHEQVHVFTCTVAKCKAYLGIDHVLVHLHVNESVHEFRVIQQPK